MRLIRLLAVPLVRASIVQTQQQVLIPADLEKENGNTGENAPVIGVHFADSYAVAAARYDNGTMRDLSKVDGDSDYKDLMSRWTRLHWLNEEWWVSMATIETRLTRLEPLRFREINPGDYDAAQ